VKRKIIEIDGRKCDGCGVCIPACPEGAIQLIDGKARLISDLCCDGLGACLGHCPQGAITIEEREAAPYDERQVMANIIRQGTNVIRAHLEHLREHGEDEYLAQAVAVLEENRLENPLQSEDRSCAGRDAGATVNFGFRACAGEAGCHAGESPVGRIGLFTTESWVREEAARPNPKARPRLNCPVATTVNLI